MLDVEDMGENETHKNRNLKEIEWMQKKYVDVAPKVNKNCAGHTVTVEFDCTTNLQILPLKSEEASWHSEIQFNFLFKTRRII